MAREKKRTLRFPALDGGLNLRDAELNLKENESPEMANLWWDEGVLQSRPGQELVTDGWRWNVSAYGSFTASDIPYAAAAFQEGFVVHIGGEFYTSHRYQDEFYSHLRPVPASASERYQGVPTSEGTFFRFGPSLFYKNPGGFYRLSYNSAHADNRNPLTVLDMTEDAYVPTILVNADPATGNGDSYEPENRLSTRKRVAYTPASAPSTVVLDADGFKRAFSLGVNASSGNLRGVSAVYVNQTELKPALYSVDVSSGTVLFNAAPADGAVLTFALDIGICEYHLPDERLDAVTLVKWDNLYLTPGRDYSADTVTGIVTFTNAPPVGTRVEITYGKANTAARDALMNCRYAAAYESGDKRCIVAGGNARQPNAVYWSGVSGDGMDPSYWPADNVMMLGDTSDPVTAFGKQYGEMIVFKARGIGKLSLSAKSVNGFEKLSLSYSAVNDKIGCDCPDSVQLINNNLTFANTVGGVYRLRSSSSARENNVERVSDKVNGSDTRPGLLYDFRVAGNTARSFDDGRRYWLAVNGHVWLWDYALSANDPVWFYFTDMDARLFVMRDGVPCLINRDGNTVRLGATYHDFGNAIRKVYQFPARNFGSYERLKDVTGLLISMRADTPSDTELVYETDYETRKDAVNLTVTGYDRLSERNLEARDLSVPRHAAVFRRAPKCRHVRHFSFRLENNAPGDNLAAYAVELQYRYTGRER